MVTARNPRSSAYLSKSMGIVITKKMAGHENLTMQRKNCHLSEMKRRASSMLGIKLHDFSSFKESSRILAKHYSIKFKIRFGNQHALGLKSNSATWNFQDLQEVNSFNSFLLL